MVKISKVRDRGNLKTLREMWLIMHKETPVRLTADFTFETHFKC